MKKNKIIFITIGIGLALMIFLLIVKNQSCTKAQGLHFDDNKKNTKTIVKVGTSADFPPFSFIDQGAIKGFDIDLTQEIAHRLHASIEISDLPFFTLIPELNFGAIDLLAGGITKTPQRAERIAFSIPYLHDIKLLVITLAKNHVHSLEDLAGKKVAVNDGYVADLYMSEHESIQLERIPTVADAFIALTNEQVYAFVSADNTVAPFFNNYGQERFSLYTIPDITETYCLAVDKNNTALLEKINLIITAMEQDGSLKTLKEKWNLG